MSADERIVHRSNQRKRKMRRRKIILRTVLTAVLLMAGIILALTVFFNINKITVSGDAVYSSEDIINASGISQGDNLIFLSKKKVGEAVTQKLPYIGSVTVKRKLPTGVELAVKKTEAAYAVVSDGYYTLVDRNAKVLEKNIEYIGENIILLNPGEISSAEIGSSLELADGRVLEKLSAVSKALQDTSFEGITSIDLSDIYNIKLVYQGRITLVLGETNNSTLPKKIDLGKSAVQNQDEENVMYRGTINLTVNGKAYWSEETAPAEEPSEETPENTEASSENASEGVSGQ